MKKRSAIARNQRNHADEVRERAFSDAVVFFHEAIAARLGMSAADWKCLGLLEQHGEMTAGRLAELSGFTTGAITGILDRLETSGYARRRSNPADRRSVLVGPGELGRLKEETKPVFSALRRAMGEVARRYTPEERTIIESWLEGTTAVLREETKKLRSR